MYGWILRASCRASASLGLITQGERHCCRHLAEQEVESWEVNHLAEGQLASRWWR